MKLIIAGSRTVRATPEEIWALINHYGLQDQVDEVVSGTAKGIDSDGEAFAARYGIRVKRMPADWDKYGRSAGHKRNGQMGEYGDALLLIWDGESDGSAGMKAVMKRLGKPVYEAIVRL
jgi:hypothetical protein